MNFPKLNWMSNPFAFGAIQLQMEGRKSSIGGISNVNGRVRGYLLGKQVYDGDNEDAAMLAVETELRGVEEGSIRGLLD